MKIDIVKICTRVGELSIVVILVSIAVCAITVTITFIHRVWIHLT